MNNTNEKKNLLFAPTRVSIYGSYSGVYSEDNPFLDFHDDCLFNKGHVIGTASLKIEMLVNKYLSRLNTENEMTIEEFMNKKEEIMQDLTLEEREIMNTFGYVCMQMATAYSMQKPKTLKRERND